MVNKTFLSGLAIFLGTCIGAGILGLPYVISKTGFLIGAGYIILIGLIILLVNLYLGEVILRTKEKYQLAGYAEKYLGAKGKILMNFAIVFGIYSAIVAYIFAIGDSLSFLFFQNLSYAFMFSILFSILMSFILWKGFSFLKHYEKYIVGLIFVLFFLIAVLFSNKLSFQNLSYINPQNWFLPLGVVIFSLLAFSAIPEINFAIQNKKRLMKKILIYGIFIAVLFYLLFNLIFVGFKGLENPDVATLGLGPIFILLGIFILFSPYLVLGNALKDHFKLDSKYSKLKSWFLTSIIPVLIFILIKFFNLFSFTTILSIGGIVSGGLTAILILLMNRKAKKNGNRKPEYKLGINWIVTGLLSLIFIAGIVLEIFNLLR